MVTLLAPARRRFRNNQVTAALVLSQVWLAGGALVINALSARGLGPEARGELALYLQICYSANLIALLGRNRSYLVTSAGVGGLGAALREISLLSRLPLVLAAAAAVTVGALLSGGSGVAVIFIIAALWLKMAGGLVVNTHRAAAIAANRGGPYLWATGVGQCLMVACAALLLVVQSGTVEIWLAVYGLTALIPYLVIERVIRRRDTTPPRGAPALEAARRLGVRLMPAAVTDALLTRADRFLLPALSSFEQLGVYAVVSTMTELINWPLKQYIDSKSPQWALEASAGTLRPWLILRTTVIYAASTATVVALTTSAMLVPVFGSAYRAGLQLILPLSAACGLYAISALAVALATAAHRPGLTTWVSGTGMVVAIPLYVLLIPRYGAMGAALGSLSGYGISALLGIAAIASVARSAKSPA